VQVSTDAYLSKKYFFIIFYSEDSKDLIDRKRNTGNDQEVEFYEIKIQLFQEIKLFLIMRSNFFVIFHEIEIP
jgi:hypothetical protein